MPLLLLTRLLPPVQGAAPPMSWDRVKGTQTGSSPESQGVLLTQVHPELFALPRTEAVKLFVLLQSKWPTENLFVSLYVFTVNVFSDLCHKVNHNYFCKHVTVAKQNCICLGIYITSLKALEWNLKKKFFPPNISVRNSISDPWQSYV